MTRLSARLASLFLPNLEFEDELTDTEPAVSARKQQRLRDLEPVMAHLAESASDVVLTDPLAMPADLPPCLEAVSYVTATDLRDRDLTGYRLVPWGWSSRAGRLADRLGLRTPRPPVGAVQIANSRRFQVPHDLVAEVVVPDSGLPVWLSADSGQGASAADHADDGPSEPAVFSTLCHSTDGVLEVLSRFRRESVSAWVIKADFSHAARNRILGRGDRPSDSQMNWLRRRFSRSEVVAVEPWVSRVAECGLQFEILPADRPAPGRVSGPASGSLAATGTAATGAAATGTIRFDGAAQLINDATGRYVGSLVASEPATHELWRPAVRHGFWLSKALQGAGYFGWLGIDCMVFRTSAGSSYLRLSHDVNARCTMGRIALRMTRLMQPGEFGFWCHIPAELLERDFTGRERISLPSSKRDHVSTLCTSPRRIGQRPAQMLTALLTSPDPEQLLCSVRHVQGLHGVANAGH